MLPRLDLLKVNPKSNCYDTGLKNIKFVNWVKNIILNNIKQWLLTSKSLTEFEAKRIVSELPIIFAVKHDDKDTPHWCFMIDEKIRRFDNVLAVNIVANKINVIDSFFLLSVQDFTQTNFLILTQNSSLYYISKIEKDSIEKIIIQLIKQLEKTKYNSITNKICVRVLDVLF